MFAWDRWRELFFNAQVARRGVWYLIDRKKDEARRKIFLEKVKAMKHFQTSTFEIAYFFGYESRFDLPILFIMIYTFLSRWLEISLIRCI